MLQLCVVVVLDFETGSLYLFLAIKLTLNSPAGIKATCHRAWFLLYFLCVRSPEEDITSPGSRAIHSQELPGLGAGN